MNGAIEFRTLYDDHVAFVWRNLRRLGVAPSDVEDRVQEVFVVAHRRIGDYQERGHGPRAWLFQIVLRIASEWRRHRRRHPEDVDGGAAQELEHTEAEQAELIARREALDQLDIALASLDVDKRAVLVLHEIEDMTAPEIAESLSLPVNTVYSRLRVARQQLEAALRMQDRKSGVNLARGGMRVIAGGAR